MYSKLDSKPIENIQTSKTRKCTLYNMDWRWQRAAGLADILSTYGPRPEMKYYNGKYNWYLL